MRLRRIDLPGFGCLSDFRAEFAPGLNLFFGENEAGKSTLQQAVCALLYGFYDGDRARPDETARQERFRPWPDGRPGAAYRGSLEYELAHGRLFEVRRDFATADVPTQLIDLVTGEDLAAQYGRGRHGNIPFARRQLGMPRAVFQSCAFIGQGEVLEVSNGASPREIGDAIAALADSSRRDVSAKVAMDRLDSFLQKIGSDRARTAELPSARESLRVAEAELQALDAAQLAVSQRAAELRAARGRLSALEADVIRTQALFLKARRAGLERKLRELAEADDALERATGAMSDLRAFAQFPAGERDTVLRLRDRLGLERQATVEAARALAEKRSFVSDDDRAEFESLRASVGTLSAESIAELRPVAYAASPAPNNLKPAVRVLRAFLRSLRAIARFLLRRRDSVDAAQAAEPAVSRDEAQAILERHTRYLTLRPAVEGLADAEERQRTAESALAATEVELRGLLDGAGMETGRNLEESLAAFLEGCAKHTLYEVAQAEAEEAAHRRKLLLGDKTAEAMRGQLEECETRLGTLVGGHPELAGLEPDGSAGEFARRLEVLQAEGRALEVRVARLDEEVRASLKDHRPRSEIEEDAERCRREVRRLGAAREAAQMAREAISQAMVAVYRDFAPAVNAFLSEGFAHITGGRYQRAHVDPATLRVSLLLPETGRVIADPPVSRGTLTAAYILMRMGLANHMSTIGEPVPLVLDDPFVDMDGRRLERMLEFIMQVTERAQVLLFTKDAHVAGWFEANCVGGSHAMHRLSASAVLTSAL